MDDLRAIRERKGLTISQLSARASIPGRVLTEYEDGVRIITQQHLRALARVLYVNPEDINPRSTPRQHAAEPSGSENRPAEPARSAPATQQAATSQPATTAPRPIERTVQPTTSEPTSPAPQPVAERPAIGAVVRPAPQYSTPNSAPANTPPAVTAPPSGPVHSPTGQTERPPFERNYERPFERPPFEGGPRRPGGAPRPGGRPGGRREESAEGMPTERPGSRKPREPKPPPPPQPITPGQINELLRLGARREMSREAIETRVGKSLDQLTRPEARQWIGTLRNEDASDVSVARSSLALPEVIDAFESEYLREIRDRGTPLHFLLFNGQQITGTVVEFTPYTITIKDTTSNDEVTLRKLAIVYYLKESESDSDADAEKDTAEESGEAGFAASTISTISSEEQHIASESDSAGSSSLESSTMETA